MNALLIAGLAGLGIYLYGKVADAGASTASTESTSTAGETVEAAETWDASKVVTGMTFTEAKDVYANAPGIGDVQWGLYFDAEGNPYGGEGNSYWKEISTGKWKIGTPAGLISDLMEKLDWMSLLETPLSASSAAETVEETETETETASTSLYTASELTGPSNMYNMLFTAGGYHWHDYSEGPAYWRARNGDWYIAVSPTEGGKLITKLTFMDWLDDPALLYAHPEFYTDLPSYKPWA